MGWVEWVNVVLDVMEVGLLCGGVIVLWLTQKTLAAGLQRIEQHQVNTCGVVTDIAVGMEDNPVAFITTVDEEPDVQPYAFGLSAWVDIQNCLLYKTDKKSEIDWRDSDSNDA